MPSRFQMPSKFHMRRGSHSYTNLEDGNMDRESVAWYWRVVALTASWMIFGGYLILPATWDVRPDLRFSHGVLTIIVATLMTTGYSFTALLCFACPSWTFQADSVFLPTLSASAFGLFAVMWSFASSTRFTWNNASIITTVLAGVSALVYGFLLIRTHRKIAAVRKQTRSISTHSETSFYKNFIANMYPSARPNPEAIPLSDEERINQQMAMLLMKNDSGPSPDASQSTFKINLPDEPDHELSSDTPLDTATYRSMPSPALTSPRPTRNSVQDYYSSARGRNGQDPQPAGAWERGHRGRSTSELTVDYNLDRGRSAGRDSGDRSRAVSREERRREIEMGNMAPGQ